MIGDCLDIRDDFVPVTIEGFTVGAARDMGFIEEIAGEVTDEKALERIQEEHPAEKGDEEIVPSITCDSNTTNGTGVHGTQVSHDIEKGKGGVFKKGWCGTARYLDTTISRVIEKSVTTTIMLYHIPAHHGNSVPQ